MDREKIKPWREGFDKAYTEQKNRLVTLAMAFTGERHMAEDVVHDVFAKLLVEKQHLRNGQPVGAFLTVAVRNRAIDMLRTGRHRQQREQTRREEHSISPDPTEQASAREEQERLLRQVSRLPAELKEVISLRIWGEWTFEQIAELQQIAKSTAHERYNQALNQLRQGLMTEEERCIRK